MCISCHISSLPVSDLSTSEFWHRNLNQSFSFLGLETIPKNISDDADEGTKSESSASLKCKDR